MKRRAADGRAEPLRAAALGAAGAEVRRARPGARRARARDRGRAGRGADARFRLFRPLPLGKLEGAAFYALLPFRVARELRVVPPGRGARAGRAGDLARPARHGRSRARARRSCSTSTATGGAPTRLYGSPLAARLRPARATRSRGSRVRRADAVRTISRLHERARPLAGRRAGRRLPGLHGSRSVSRDGAGAAAGAAASRSSSACSSATRRSTCSPRRGGWPRPRVPGAELRDRRPRDAERRRRAAGRRLRRAVSTWTPALADGRGRAARSTRRRVLVLPSRSEGLRARRRRGLLPRRGVVGSRVGGIPDLVADGVTGVLVPPGDAGALADALVRVLSDRGARASGSATRRARGGRAVAGDAGGLRARMRELVERVVAPVRLVVVTQQVDPASPVLGATVAKLRALAARVDELVVLADSAVDGVLPDERSCPPVPLATKAGRGAALRGGAHAASWRVAAAGRRARAHVPDLRGAGRAARAAARGPASCSGSRTGVRAGCSGSPSASRRRWSPSTAARFRSPSRKLVPIGHGIDLTEFPCVERPPAARLRLLALGRTSPAKGLEPSIRAVAEVPEATLRCTARR